MVLRFLKQFHLQNDVINRLLEDLRTKLNCNSNKQINLPNLKSTKQSIKTYLFNEETLALKIFVTASWTIVGFQVSSVVTISRFFKVTPKQKGFPGWVTLSSYRI